VPAEAIGSSVKVGFYTNGRAFSWLYIVEVTIPDSKLRFLFLPIN